jgi:hypothetical protein
MLQATPASGRFPLFSGLATIHFRKELVIATNGKGAAAGAPEVARWRRFIAIDGFPDAGPV